MQAYLVTWFLKNQRFRSIVITTDSLQAACIVREKYGDSKDLYIETPRFLPEGLVYTIADDPE